MRKGQSTDWDMFLRPINLIVKIIEEEIKREERERQKLQVIGDIYKYEGMKRNIWNKVKKRCMFISYFCKRENAINERI